MSDTTQAGVVRVRILNPTAAEIEHGRQLDDERQRNMQAVAASVRFLGRHGVTGSAFGRTTMLTFDNGDHLLISPDEVVCIDADSDFAREGREAGERAAALWRKGQA